MEIKANFAKTLTLNPEYAKRLLDSVDGKFVEQDWQQVVCDECGSDGFRIEQRNYETDGICLSCGHRQELHSG